jgi:glycosyltransferase involved in cell wall biosynthesis
MGIDRILASYKWTYAEEGTHGVAKKTKDLVNRQYLIAKDKADSQKKELASRAVKDGFVDVCFINGCSYELPHPIRYRVDHQMEQLKAAGYTVMKTDGDPSLDLLRRARMFIVYRFPYTDAMGEFIAAAKRLNKTVLYDIDDLVISTDYTDTIPYIQTMSPDDRALYDDGVIRMGRTLELCDGAITTTEALADELRKFVPRVFVNRNTASDEMLMFCNQANYRRDSLVDVDSNALTPAEREIQMIWKRRAVEKGDTVTIGYFSGSITHNDDFELVLPTIVAIMEEFSQVRLMIGGELDLPPVLQKFESRVDRFPFCSWRALPFYIARCDINIAPLADTLFNRAKSENKWVEASLVKVPTVASRVGAFERMVDDGKTGLLCETEQDWERALVRLIESAEERRRIGEAAYTFCKDNCTTIRTAGTIKRIVEECMTENIALVLPTTNISGGVLVALKHAVFLQESGRDVFMVTNCRTREWIECDGHAFPVLDKYVENDEMDGCPLTGRIDTLVATLWNTVEFALRYPYTGKRKYLVQNYETDFYEPDIFLRAMAEATYQQVRGIEYLTISKWCEGWLIDKYGDEVKFAPNGLDLQRFYPVQRDFSMGKVRVLIEGDCTVAYKNVDEAFAIANGLDRSRFEVWYMNYTGESKDFYLIDNNLGCVQAENVGDVYRSCHILLKTSMLESFSYPPLEMMSTGGFVVARPNAGNAEILQDEVNCLLYAPGDVEGARAAIERIADDSALRERLYAGGVETAKARDWDGIKDEILALYN